MITEVDLVRQGKGSGTDSAKVLGCDGNDGWELRSLTLIPITFTGAQNGVNKVYTLNTNIALDGSEQVFVNGLLMQPGSANDYLLTAANQVTFQAAMFAPAANDVIRIYGTSYA